MPNKRRKIIVINVSNLKWWPAHFFNGNNSKIIHSMKISTKVVPFRVLN